MTDKLQVAYFTLLQVFADPRYRSCVSRVVTGRSLKRKPTKMDCRKSIRHAESSTVSAKLTFFYFIFCTPLLRGYHSVRRVKKKLFFYFVYILHTDVYLPSIDVCHHYYFVTSCYTINKVLNDFV